MCGLERIKITSFKGISSCVLDNLGAVNVFVGRNNAGKSTVLEALYFIKSLLGEKDEVGEPPIRRIMTRRSLRENNDLVRLFFNYQNANQISLKFRDTEELIFNSNVSYNRISSKLDLTSEDIKPFVFDFTASESESGITSYSVPGRGVSGGVTPFHSIYGELERDLKNVKAVDSLLFLSKVVLIDDALMREVQEIEKNYVIDLVKTGEVDSLINILNSVYALDITQMIFLDSPGGFKLFMRTPSSALDIDDFGDGFRYAFSTLAIAQATKNSAILLEEPENHQHSGALISLFKALLHIAQDNSLQLFVSTHSLEVLATLFDLATKSVRVFHIERNRDGTITSTIVEGSDLRLSLDLGIDVRYLHYPGNKLVLVEGPTDKLFLERVVTKLYGQSTNAIGLSISLMDNKDYLVRSLRIISRLKLPVTVFVMPDYDNEDLSTILQKIKVCLSDVKHTVENNKIVLDSGLTIVCLPLGLPEDDEIRGLTKYIRKNAMEDYMLKILKNSPTLLHELGYENFNEMMDDLYKKPTVSGAKIAKDQSKGYLALLSLKNDMDDNELYSKIINECGNKLLKNILQPLQPLLEI